MKLQRNIAILVGALALATAPAAALASQPAEPGSQGHGKGPHYTPEVPTPTPGPHASLPEKANAYGWRCREESRKHVAGHPGTPFSLCVTAMAKAANTDATARQACRAMSRKHVKGNKGTPFSQCVVAAAKLKREQREQQS